jgi:hypothetical protein
MGRLAWWLVGLRRREHGCKSASPYHRARNYIPTGQSGSGDAIAQREIAAS